MNIRHRALGTRVECLQGLSLWAGVCILLLKGLGDHEQHPVASRPIPEKRVIFSRKKSTKTGLSRDRKEHPKSQQSSKVCLGTHAGSLAGWSQRKIGLQNCPERRRCASGAVNTMLLAHCTKSLRGHFLVHFNYLWNCFERAVEPKSRPEPEKVDFKKHIKN